MPFFTTGIWKSTSGRSSQSTSGRMPARLSVKQVKVKGGVMLRATIA
jgi:hypothetical protein